MKKFSYIFTCEHAGNFLPEGFDQLFEHNKDVLESHRGWDPGALDAAEFLSRKLRAPLFYGSITRLLIEFNRSLHSADLYSEFSRNLDQEKKALLLNAYNTYRKQAFEKIRETLEKTPVVHISVHTFTPVLDGETRAADIGILFDPQRGAETRFAEWWKRELDERNPGRSVKFNYPYLGADDGFTVYLRNKFDERYAGIELEINQKHLHTPEWASIKRDLAETLQNFQGF